MYKLIVTLFLILLLTGCNSTKSYDVYIGKPTLKASFFLKDYFLLREAINQAITGKKELNEDEIFSIGYFFIQNCFYRENRLYGPKKNGKNWEMIVSPVYIDSKNPDEEWVMVINDELELTFQGKSYHISQVLHGPASEWVLDTFSNSFPIEKYRKKLKNTNWIKIKTISNVSNLIGEIKFTLYTSPDVRQFLYQDYGLNLNCEPVEIQSFNVGLISGNQIYVLPKIFSNSPENYLIEKSEILDEDKTYTFTISYLKYFKLKNPKFIIFTSDNINKNYSLSSDIFSLN